ncbi:MAG TPA: phosphatase PAP2 family protein [Stellaceae bacterium]|nr:phosphatase PAP2 family protein [Stellaceae bacterium]
MSSSARARWLAIFLIVILDGIGLAHDRLHLAPIGLASGAGALIVFGALAAIYTYWRPDERIVDLAQCAAQLIALFAATGCFSYIVTATNLPLANDAVAAVDRALGFDWLRWFGWVEQHPVLRLVLQLAYPCAIAQMVLIACYLSLTGQAARSRELVWTIMLSLLIIVPLSGLLPVESAWLYYNVGGSFDAASVADFNRLRAGQLHDVDLRQLQGIISFPSFHTCLALLFPYVVRKRRRVLLPIALLNGVMILSVPTEGGHFLVDVIAGAAVAAVAAWLAAQIEGLLDRRQPAAATSPAE